MDPAKFRLVVTSGPTREWLDPVRFISNPSSGRTGWEIAKKGVKLFKEVVYISGPGNPAYRQVPGAVNIIVDTTNEMGKEVRKAVGPRTLLVMAAAPADYSVKNPGKQKIKKTENTSLQLSLVPTVDILLSIKYLRHREFFKVGFAAETNDIKTYALDKLKRKRLDYICANRVYKEVHGFSRNENTLEVYDQEGNHIVLGPDTKAKNAAGLLKHLIRSLPGSE